MGVELSTALPASLLFPCRVGKKLVCAHRGVKPGDRTLQRHMARRNRNARRRTKLQRAAQGQQPRQPGRGGGGRASRMGSGGMGDYIRLLSDPCGGPITRPPYTGTGSSYLVRTTNFYQPQTSGNVSSMDVVLEFTPWNAPAMLLTGSANTGDSITVTSFSLQNFVTIAAFVQTYRPVAACAKWVSSSPIAARAGQVGMSYSASRTYAPGNVVTAFDGLSRSMRVDSNGAVCHECNWLPSFGDERFGGNGEANISGAGSVQMVLKGVDTVAVGGNSAPNGYFEFTVVWEWEPSLGNTGTNNNVVPSVMPPTRASLQQVLASVRDMTGLIFRNIGMARAAYQYAVGSSYERGPGMLEL